MGLNALLGAIQGGDYINGWKLLPPLFVLFVWARLLTWADKDAVDAHLPRIPLNLAFLGGLILAYALFFLLPSFLVAFAVLLLLVGAETGTYLQLRKRKVGLKDLRKDFENWLKSWKGNAKDVKLEAGGVGIVTKSGVLPPPDADSPQRAAYDAVQAALSEPLQKEAEQVDLAPEESGLVVKYKVDGFEYQGKSIEKSVGAAAIAYLKGLAGLDVAEQRKPQNGGLKLTIDNRRIEMSIMTAGTRAGESMRLMADPKKRFERTMDQLGLSGRQFDTLIGLIGQGGIILVTAPRQQGLTTTLYGIIRSHDAFLSHIHTLERKPDKDLEGITQNKLAPTAMPEDEAKEIAWIISQEPDVILIPQVDSPKTAANLIKFAKGGKRVYAGMRAASTFDALDQWRKLVGDDRLATEALKLVINGRVLRTLCSACKVGYVPDPVTLRKLGISPEKVSTLFQARTQPLRDPKGNPIPCEFCHDVHFKGRSGVYEMFVIDDDAREVINAGRSPNQIFKKQRGRYLQEEALELVQAGQTSVQEVLRVLNATGGGGGGSAKRPPAGGGGGAPPAAARSPRPSSPSSTPRPAGSAPRIRKT